MNFETWEPVYETVLADMGYDRTGDERARDLLADLVAGGSPIDPAGVTFAGETVVVAAPGPVLLDDQDVLEAADTVIAAGLAADRLLDAGLPVDWVVTDLDGHAGRIGEFTAAGIPVCVHAHGNNRLLLESHVPTFDLDAVLPTTQAAPRGPVRDFGGFTDGDRAAFFADARGVAELAFAGWDLADPNVSDEKARKLTWAARLLAWLEARRGESFAALDGLRGDPDVTGRPADW